MCAATRREATSTLRWSLAILNQADRFNLVIDVIDRVPQLANKAHI